jgi:hypothetical protein
MRGIRIIWVAGLLVVGTASVAGAVYTPNPAGRWEANRVFLAGDLQYNWEKDLDDPSAEIDDEVGIYARLSYAFMENATVYGRVGVQDADHLDTQFAIGGGVQAAWALPQARDWAVGGSFDVLWWDAEASNGADIDYTEIQIAPAVSYSVPQMRSLTPYAGLAFDFVTGDFEEDDPVGILFGASFDLDKHWRMDAQMRLISEDGLFLSVGYLF